MDPLKGNNSVLLNYEPAQFRLRGLQVGGDLSLVHGSPGPVLEDGEVILNEDKDPAPKLSIPVVPDMLLPRDIVLRATTAAGEVSEISLGSLEPVRRAVIRTSSWKTCRYQQMGCVPAPGGRAGHTALCNVFPAPSALR